MAMCHDCCVVFPFRTRELLTTNIAECAHLPLAPRSLRSSPLNTLTPPSDRTATCTSGPRQLP
eukprot:13636566-Alexandrium_andersonii.AAC.1